MGVILGNMEAKSIMDCEKLAIEFAEFIREQCYDTGEKWYYQHDNEEYTSNEMLGIFKRERSETVA